jgi:hypothetical protein
VKIAYLLLLPRPLPHFAMQQVNPLSYTAAKEIFESVLQSLNDYQDFATQYQLVHR